jgi:hypothetical protein
MKKLLLVTASIGALATPYHVADAHAPREVAKIVAAGGPPVSVPFFVDTTLDLNEVQSVLQNTMNSIRVVDRCGDNYNVWDARVLPNGQSLKVDFHARYYRNKCVITTVPEWRGLWHMEWHDKVVGETILIEQAGHIVVDLTPAISPDGAVTVDAHVVTADMDGLLGRLKLNGEVKSLLAGKIREALKAKLAVALPQEVVKTGVRPEVSFIDLGGGKLGMRLKATGKVQGGA